MVNSSYIQPDATPYIFYCPDTMNLIQISANLFDFISFYIVQSTIS